MRKIILPFAFLLVTPFVIAISIMEFAYLSSAKIAGLSFFNTQRPGIAYAALPSSTDQVAATIESVDDRNAKVTAFFHQYNSVLEGYSQNIIQAADTYHIDYRLIPAIAMQESQGCKKEITNTHNCWGWGIYGKHVTSFDSYPQAIDTISKLLAKNYVSKGLDTPEEIQKAYNPSNKNEWVDKVNYFISQL